MVIRPVISVPLPWLTILFGRFYPSRSSEQDRKKYRFPRSLKVTKLGVWYITALLLIGVAAINTGNNLLYMVVGMLLSLIVISGLMSESTLRGVRVKREFPGDIFADSPIVARLHIENTKRILPSYSFTVKEAASPELLSEAVYIIKLSSGVKLKRHPAYTFNRRGIHKLTELKIETTFPFALFKKGKAEENTEEVFIYPRIKPIEESISPSNRGLECRKKARKKGDGSTLYGLREYKEGEDARNIDWKASARAAEFLAKEFEAEADERVLIDFDNSECGSEKIFEDSVSEAASLAVHYTRRGFHVGLKTRDDSIECARSGAHLKKILKLLALIEPSGPSSKAPKIVVRPL
jgi:uncharacterized protein (DUF58 family)